MEKAKKIVLAGNVLVDHIKTISFYPEKSYCSPILEEERAVGGCVCNTGIDIKTLYPEFSVNAVGLIGDDQDGAFLKTQLKKHGLNVDGVKVYKELGTSYADVFTEKESGARTFFSYKGAGSSFCEENLPKNLKCDLFHIGYILLLDELDKFDKEYGTKMARLLCNLQKKGITTSIDVLSESSDRYVKTVRPALKYTDLAVINELEGGKVAEIEPRDSDGKISISSLKLIAEKLASFGVKKKVVIHAPEVGVCLDVKSKNFTVIPSLKLEKGFIKGTVGAGDAFCAGYLSSFVLGKTDEDALKFASLSACCNLTAKDSISGMRNAEETLKLEKKGRIELC